MVNNFDQSELEECVAQVLRDASVSKYVYYNRPSSATADLADFVVCKVTGSVNDRFALGQCTLSIHLFVRNAQNFKNGKKLSVMQGKCIHAVPRKIGRFIIGGTPRILGDTDDGNGYHVRIINYQITIKATE